jgi:hypothetical protein
VVWTSFLTKIEEQFRALGRSRTRRQGLGVVPQELNQFHHASMVVPTDAMKLPLLFPRSGFVPHTVKELFVELMRPQAIPLQAVERKRIHAPTSRNQHHERNKLLSTGRHVSRLIGLPDLPDVPFGGSQDLLKVGA